MATNSPNSAAQIILNHDPADAALPYVHVAKFVEYAIDWTPVVVSVATATIIPSSGEFAAHLYALTVVDIGRWPHDLSENSFHEFQSVPNSNHIVSVVVLVLPLRMVRYLDNWEIYNTGPLLYVKVFLDTVHELVKVLLR